MPAPVVIGKKAREFPLHFTRTSRMRIRHMATSTTAAMMSYAFDDRNIRWYTLGDFEHFVFAMLDVDVSQKIVDFIRHCSRDSEFDMDRPGDRFYTTGPNLFPQESQVCSDQVYMCQTPQRGLSIFRTSPHRNVCLPAVTSRTRPAHDVPSSPLATKPDNVRCTTSAISPQVARLPCW